MALAVKGRVNTSIFNLFKAYYEKSFKPCDIVLPDIQFRHFRFQLFGEKIRFERLRDILRTPEALHEAITRCVPKNAYYTPVKWLSPIYVGKRKEELDVMLSFPLFFDIDMKQLKVPTFQATKVNTATLIEYLEDEYTLYPDLLVFSGRQGFHVYYWKVKRDEKLIRLSPTKRKIEFKKRRREILDKIRRKDIVVDEQITFDPYRIMRIPNTLHGTTGLIAKPLKTIESFDPKRDARAFSKRVYKENFVLPDYD